MEFMNKAELVGLGRVLAILKQLEQQNKKKWIFNSKTYKKCKKILTCTSERCYHFEHYLKLPPIQAIRYNSVHYKNS